MNERADLFCGCAYIKTGAAWWHVVACPEHRMDLGPHDEVPAPSARGVSR